MNLVSRSFSGTFAKRNRALFILGIRSGFRLSELLSLRVGDVLLKGSLDPQTPVCCRRVRDVATGLRRAISREQAWRILTEAFAANQLTGKLGTHEMRQTFANRVYERLGHDLVKTQRALGHKNINSTVAYLSFQEEDITAAILAA
jgi:site-specific recombinase XerD